MGEKTQKLKILCQQLGLKYVGHRGHHSSPVWQIGEAPGSEETKLGFPFVGPSGWHLDKFLTEAGFDKESLCFTNPYKVQPPGNDIHKLKDLGIPLEVYEEAFLEELFEYKPPFIVCNGATPLEFLCPETKEAKTKPPLITKWRGSLLTSYKLPWPHYVIPNIHPAFVMRDWSERDFCVFIHQKIFEEFSFYRTSGILQPLPSRQLISNPSYHEAVEYLRDCLAARYVSVDLELLGRRVPFVFGFSHDPSHAISLEILNQTWSKEELVKVWRLIDEILRAKVIVGQNYTEFDANWIDCLGLDSGINCCHDTRVRHHVLWPELPHSLQFMTQQYTREPYYKDEGRGWQLGKNLDILKRYNCKDVAVTLEVFHKQEEEFNEQPIKKNFYENFEMPLARAFFYTDKRGIYTNEVIRKLVRTEVVDELQTLCKEIESITGVSVTAKKQGSKDTRLNLGSPMQLLPFLNSLGIKLQINRKTHKETTNEEALNKAFAETGHPVLKHMGRIRELNKMLGTYIDAKLLHNTFYFSSSVTGTVGGRRSSKKNFLGYGSNAQNQPKHSDIGKKFREVYIVHPGSIFLSCDQMQAEDWIVQGLIADVSGHTKGIDELRAGVDRHQRLASEIFNIPREQISKDSMERYLGKKTRHAGNYGMEADKMSTEMAKEGFHVPKADCQKILNMFHRVEPDIRGVFHKWVEEQLNTTRILRSPLGRERFFFGLHPKRDNGKIYREAYSYIPQTTVGDNTGLAVLYLEDNFPGHFICEVHDSALLEVRNNFDSIWEAFSYLKEAFHRTIHFQNGFELEIPIEFELGFDLQRTQKCPGNVSKDGLRSILDGLNPLQEVHLATTIGQH